MPHEILHFSGRNLGRVRSLLAVDVVKRIIKVYAYIVDRGAIPLATAR